MKKYLYLRESTTKQDSDRQMIEINNYLSRNNESINDYNVFSDNGISGGSLISERTSAEIVRQLQRGDFILTADMSRVSRNLVDRLMFIQMCDKLDVRIFNIEGNKYETLNDSSNGISSIIDSWKDSTFLVDLKKKTKAGIAASKAKGNAVGGDPRCWGMKAKHMKNLSTEERAEYREDTLNNARKASADNRRLRAQNNPNNIAYWFFIGDYIKINNNSLKIDFKDVAMKLNERGIRTSTGMEFNQNRASERYIALKRIFTNQ